MEKLVRDLIPALMLSQGVEPKTRVLDVQERFPWLLAKLREEVEEVCESPCLEECADVLEVVRAIAAHLGFDAEALDDAARKKVIARGAFASGVVLEVPGSEIGGRQRGNRGGGGPD